LADNAPIVGARVIFAGDSCLTDSAGLYHFENVAEGKYQIIVRAENFGEYRDSVNLLHQMTYNVPLTGGLKIFGQVRDLLERSVVGAIVSIANRSDTTDDSGYYDIALKPHGEISIVCQHPDHPDYVDVLHYSPGAHRYDIILAGILNIFGRVTLPDYAPASGATISVGEFADTADDSGEYSLSVIPTSQMILICQYPDFPDFVDTLDLVQGNLRIDVQMGSPILEVVFVSEDAEISMTEVTFWDFGAGLGMTPDTINRGQDPTVGVFMDMWLEDEDPTQPNPQIAHVRETRFLLKLPNLGTGGDGSEIDSATLVLHMLDMNNPVYIIQTASDWTEDKVTWASRPAETNKTLDMIYGSNSICTMDVTDLYKQSRDNPPSLLFSTGMWMPGWYWAGFASSENADVWKRPYVKIKYKR